MITVRAIHVSVTTLEGPTPAARFENILRSIALQRRELLGECDAAKWQTSTPHIVCSTTLGETLSWTGLSWNSLQSIAGFKRFDGDFGVFVDAYECASWGYAIRFARGVLGAQRVLLSIVDGNLLDLAYWKSSSDWGVSGFVSTQLALELGEVRESQCQTGFCAGGMAEFAMHVRRAAGQAEEARVAIPFCPPRTRSMFARALKRSKLTEDLYYLHGHCFGSDPWMGIAYDNDQSPLSAKIYLACSLALRGYFAIYRINLSHDCVVMNKCRRPSV